MPKTAVETAVCDVCGAEVRDGSLFCYNCGGSFSKAESPVEIPIPAQPIAEPREPKANGLTPPVPYEPAKRKAETSDRRKVRAANRQPAEIVWQPREGVSWVFVIASLVFVFIALVVVIAAFYLR